MLADIIKQIEKNKTEEPKVSVNIADNIYLNRDIFKSKIEHLDEIPDRELYALVKESYPTILEHIMNRTDLSYVKSFSNMKFLNALIQVLSAEYAISYQNILCCNKLAYDYLTFSNADPKIRSMFFTLSKIVNRNLMQSLLAIGISEDLAAYLALARNSTSDEAVNIKRVNFLLVQQDAKSLTVQRLVNIYSRLFNGIRDLFLYTMTDVYNESTFEVTKNEEPEKYKSIMTIYINQADAVVAILNSLEFFNIYYIIAQLSELCAFNNYTSDNVRYSLRAMAQTPDNFRVITAIEQFEARENKYIV